MKFVEEGPDIPERLLQEHEDGNVVFFCGAGISTYPAGLPNFKELVECLYNDLAVTPTAVQKAAIKSGQYEVAIGLLEEAHVGGSQAVRRSLAKILTPELSKHNATETHEALLTLGRDGKGRTRLVTTNFDRLFEQVIARLSASVETFRAPLLPIPKSQWDGLAYMHGLLTDSPSQSDLDRLVLSSADFGIAYLTERWAARFVSELFRNFIVCFVGYSINDPVMRYMMDAHAANRRHGDSSNEAFAFGEYTKGQKDDCEAAWGAKNVIPLLYRKHYHHLYLRKTLQEWAATYRDGVRGKERIVLESTIGRPVGSTRQDYFLGRLLWALSDESGLPARRFAELNPSLEWLGPLGENHYGQADLSRFNVQANSRRDGELQYSLIHRPSPYDLALWMSLVSNGALNSRWDNVMEELSRWLIRHLDDPKLVLWLAKRGGQLHPNLAWLIKNRLEEFAKLEREGKDEELDRIRSESPGAIPQEMMRTLWGVLLSGRVKSGRLPPDLFWWKTRIEQVGLTWALRLELLDMLSPRVRFSDPIPWFFGEAGDHKPERIKDLVDWEIVLSSDDVHYALRGLEKNKRWIAALPELLSDVGNLLHDALDLMRELGGAGKENDLSFVYQPSVSEHPQNRDFRDWTALIDLIRDAWLVTATENPERARFVAEGWMQIPYPLFRRLAFFAAAQDEAVAPQQALEWLLSGEEHGWLWSIETQRETMRLLVSLVPKLNDTQTVELEQAILAGPPRAMFKPDIEAEGWQSIVDKGVWLRLAKLDQAGFALGTSGSTRLAKIAKRYPGWRLAENEREEFPTWTSGSWVGESDPLGNRALIPRGRKQLLNYLFEHPDLKEGESDNWRERCRESFQATAYALCKLARGESKWPTGRWRDALQAWSEEKHCQQSWRYMAPVLTDAPTDALQSLTPAISGWLYAVAKTFDGHEELFFLLSRRILDLDSQVNYVGEGPVNQAINHPVGHVTWALLDWWHRGALEDEQGLHSELRALLTDLCNTKVEKFRHGRVLLGAHVIALFRVDRDWTMEHLVPLFDWQRSEVEAQAAWAGFLWSPRLYRPLFEVLRTSFLDTAHHYYTLGDHGGQYAALLAFASLDQSDVFSTTELANATRALPEQGLERTARSLVQALEAAGDRRAEYWKNRMQPYLHDIWPQTKDKASSSIAESLGNLCIAADEAFPEAVRQTQAWLKYLSDGGDLPHRLCEKNMCRRFPEPALNMLDLAITDSVRWTIHDLQSCLKSIREAKTELETDSRFIRLVESLRQKGLGV